MPGGVYKERRCEANVEGPLLLVLTHDVDWPRRGPPREHVLARLSRFPEEERARFLERGENIYYGVELLAEKEEEAGLRSTFFFRPSYDDGSGVEEYGDVLRLLEEGGWEIGLHANSGESLEAIAAEKARLGRLLSLEVVSLRVHMLRVDPALIPQLSRVGIRFDSSLCWSREAPSARSSGCMRLGGVIELPITVMDAYLFTYWGVKPGKVAGTVLRVLEEIRRAAAFLATLLWHDSSVRMIGGREYFELLELLSSKDWVVPLRVRDVEEALARYGYECATAQPSVPSA